MGIEFIPPPPPEPKVDVTPPPPPSPSPDSSGISTDSSQLQGLDNDVSQDNRDAIANLAPQDQAEAIQFNNAIVQAARDNGGGQQAIDGANAEANNNANFIKTAEDNGIDVSQGFTADSYAKTEQAIQSDPDKLSKFQQNYLNYSQNTKSLDQDGSTELSKSFDESFGVNGNYSDDSGNPVGDLNADGSQGKTFQQSADDLNQASGIDTSENAEVTSGSGDAGSADGSGDASSADGSGDAGSADGSGDAGSADGSGDAGSADGSGDAGSADGSGDAGSADGSGDAGSADEAGGSGGSSSLDALLQFLEQLLGGNIDPKDLKKLIDKYAKDGKLDATGLKDLLKDAMKNGIGDLSGDTIKQAIKNNGGVDKVVDTIISKFGEDGSIDANKLDEALNTQIQDSSSTSGDAYNSSSGDGNSQQAALNNVQNIPQN